jgi:hypothetical protein
MIMPQTRIFQTRTRANKNSGAIFCCSRNGFRLEMLPICRFGDPCLLNEPYLITRYISSSKNEICVFLNDVQLVATPRCRDPLWVCGDIFDCSVFGSRKSTSGSRKSTSKPVLNKALLKGMYLKNAK